jgi:hypothetical protein
VQIQRWDFFYGEWGDRGPEFIYILEGEAIQNGQRLSLGWAGVAQAGTLDEQFRSETGCVFLIVYNE